MKLAVAVILLFSFAVLAAPLAAEAQPAAKVPRIAFLWAGLPGVQVEPLEGLRQGLRELGYVAAWTRRPAVTSLPLREGAADPPGGRSAAPLPGGQRRRETHRLDAGAGAAPSPGVAV